MPAPHDSNAGTSHVRVVDVAQYAGVSVGTVSNVLNRPQSVRSGTVERVQHAIDALGYVPNGAARQLRAGTSSTVGFIVLDVGNPFFTDVLRGAEATAAHNGLTVLLANSDQSPQREAAYLDLFERQRVRGVLVSPVDDDLSRLEPLHRRGVRVVLVDRGADDPRFPSVSVDDVAGGRLAASHLLDAGCSRIAFVGGPLRLKQVADRFRGAAAAVAAVQGATLEYVETDALSLDEGVRAGGELRARAAGGSIDAVFAANDLIAIGVQQALLNGPRPVAIPERVALVGYDDISFAAAAVVPITSIRQPRERMGSTAVELMIEAGSPAAQTAARHVEFAPELVARASSAR